jgi:HAD superfamily hydrolase (TIGR01509 family)
MMVGSWRIHRRIGTSGRLIIRAAERELGCNIGPPEAEALQRRHGELFAQLLPDRRPLPGAVELLRFLRSNKISYGIATSAHRPEINASLDALEIDDEAIVIEGGGVLRAKPEPDFFLACQQRLGIRVEDCYVVGDAVWDLLAARRAGMLGIGLLSGGYGEDELSRAGAFRVYCDPLELHHSLDELGILP